MAKTINALTNNSRLEYLNNKTKDWPDWKKQFTSYVPRSVDSNQSTSLDHKPSYPTDGEGTRRKSEDR